MSKLTDNGLIATGLIGTVIAALCCFTPVLVVSLAAVGLSAALGWIDYVLLPSLAFFFALMITPSCAKSDANAELKHPKKDIRNDDDLLFRNGRVRTRMGNHADPARGHSRADLSDDEAQ